MKATPRLISDDGSEFVLTGTQVIGRDDECDIRLDSSKVSRQHARVTLTEEGAAIEDLDSSNGTRVNGVRLTEPAPLAHGDTLTIDRFVLRVHLAAGGSVEEATVLEQDHGEVTVLDQDVGRPSPAASGDSPLPGSWIESGPGESTEFFSDGAALDTAVVSRQSDLPHLLLLAEDGSVSEIFELEIASSSEQQVWEIGRQSDCDLAIEDSTVSTRHAQLVYRDGRWRLVNLVSSNGIVVNGVKRLTVYLASGDKLQLGRRRLVFFDAVGAEAVASAPQRTVSKRAMPRDRRAGLWVTGLVVLVVVAAAAVWLVLR